MCSSDLETLQAFKTGLNRGHFKPGFGKNAIGQDPGGRVIIDDKNPARPRRKGATGSLRKIGFGRLTGLRIVIHVRNSDA